MIINFWHELVKRGDGLWASNMTNPSPSPPPPPLVPYNVRFTEDSTSLSEGVVTGDDHGPDGMLSQPHEAGARHESDLTTPELEASNPIKYAELHLERTAGPIRGTKKKVNYVEVNPRL